MLGTVSCSESTDRVGRLRKAKSTGTLRKGAPLSGSVAVMVDAPPKKKELKTAGLNLGLIKGLDPKHYFLPSHGCHLEVKHFSGTKIVWMIQSVRNANGVDTTGVWTDKGRVPHGPQKTFRLDGTLERLAYYDDGKPSGVWICFYSNGKESGRTHYQDGVQHGEETCCNEEGKVVYLQNWERGQLLESRDLSSETQDSVLSQEDRIVQTLITKGFNIALLGSIDPKYYFPPLPSCHLEVKYHPDGQSVYRIRSVKNSRRVSMDGAEQEQVKVSHGPEKIFRLDGTLDRFAYYDNGVLSGKCVDFHANEEQSKVVHYKAGVRDGEENFYNDENVLVYWADWQEGLMVDEGFYDSGKKGPPTSLELGLTGFDISLIQSVDPKYYFLPSPRCHLEVKHHPDGESVCIIQSVRNVQGVPKTGEWTVRDRVRHGPEKRFRLDGSLERFAHYDNGRNSGVWIFFHLNGKESGRISYKEGEKDGVETIRNEEGELRCVKYWKSGLLVKRQAIPPKTKGDLSEKQKSVLGQLVSSSFNIELIQGIDPKYYFLPLPNCHLEVTYFRGTKIVCIIQSVRNVEGMPKTGEWTDRDRVLHGPEKRFRLDGSLERLAYYDSGQNSGVWISFHSNGKESGRTSYKEGVKDGEETSCNESGNLTSWSCWRKGELLAIRTISPKRIDRLSGKDRSIYHQLCSSSFDVTLIQSIDPKYYFLPLPGCHLEVNYFSGKKIVRTIQSVKRCRRASTDGKRIEEISVPHGPEKIFRLKDGVLAGVNYYKDGKLSGRCTTFHLNGLAPSVVEYQNGEPVGDIEGYDS